MSAATVAIGFAALLIVPISDVRSIGTAGILVAGACVLLANWVLPVMLQLLGTRIEAGRLPFLIWAISEYLWRSGALASMDWLRDRKAMDGIDIGH